MEAGRVLRTRREVPRRGWVAVAIGAAAVLALVMLQPWDDGEPTSRSLFRDGEATAGAPVIEVVQPGEGARISGDTRFVWRSVDPDAVYRFTLVSDDGGEVYSTTTSDTLVTLPGDVAVGGGEFYWVVDVLLPDGRTATSGAHSFKTP